MVAQANSVPEVVVSAPASAPASIFSVDVEDWFHILMLQSTPDVTTWDALPSHVERNFRRLLDLFAEKNVRVTCFFLGWVGERFPHLVREAAAAGHEIASHGYAHQVVFGMTPAQFRADVARAREVLEQTSGTRVSGYRSPGFSCTEDTPWFFDELLAAGYRYDSSVFPAQRQFGGLPEGNRAPYLHRADTGRIIEFPISVADFVGRPMCFFGGGYLRLFPYWLIRSKAKEVLRGGRPVVFYIHPREIDPSHPRLPMSAMRRFKSYVNLRGTESKLRRLLDEFRVTTFADYLAQNPLPGAGA